MATQRSFSNMRNERMPFKSKAQRGFLFANKPKVAKKFAQDKSKPSKPKSPWANMKTSY